MATIVKVQRFLDFVLPTMIRMGASLTSAEVGFEQKAVWHFGRSKFRVIDGGWNPRPASQAGARFGAEPACCDESSSACDPGWKLGSV